MSDRKHFGDFELQVLAALLQLGRDGYGVRVRQEIEERTGRSVSIGAVYTTLSRLEAKGMVTSSIGEPTSMRGGRAKRYFEATIIGKQNFFETLRILERMTHGLTPS